MRSNENGTVLERQFLLRGLFGEIFSGRAHCLIGSAASTGSWVATTPRVASVKKRPPTYRDPVVERAFTSATSPPRSLSLLPSHPAAMMMATQSTRPAAVKPCKTELARGPFLGFVM